MVDERQGPLGRHRLTASRRPHRHQVLREQGERPVERLRSSHRRLGRELPSSHGQAAKV